MGLRVEDGGESESQPVMGWIGVAPPGKITPRESGQTSKPGLSSRDNLINHRNEKADDGRQNFALAGALIDGNVRWQQAFIVKFS